MVNQGNNAVQEDPEGKLVPEVIIEDVRDLCDNKETPLRRVAEKFQFPLSDDDYKDLAMLGQRFENTDFAAGLSLPQLGINKRAIMFEIKSSNSGGEENNKPTKDEEPGPDKIQELANIDIKKEMEKKDPNVIWPKTIWINPSYTIPRDAVLDEDYEGCFSLKSEQDFVIGPVFRLNRINYRAYDSQGRIYEGQAEGYTARVIQHEIDHLDGKLYTDYVQPDRVMQLDKYLEQVESGQMPPLEKGIVPEFQN